MMFETAFIGARLFMTALPVTYNKQLRVANTIALIAAFGTVIYMLFFQPSYLSYPNLPFVVVDQKLPPESQKVHLTPPKVKRGEPVPLRADRCSDNTDLRLYPTARTLVGNESATVLPAAYAAIAPGCTTSVSMLNLIPTTTPPGLYHIEGVSETHSMLRTIPVRWYSETFEVVE